MLSGAFTLLYLPAVFQSIVPEETDSGNEPPYVSCMDDDDKQVKGSLNSGKGGLYILCVL